MAKKKKKAVKKKVKKASKASTKDALVVASKIKAYVKAKGCMCSSEVIGAMSDCVYCCLDKAIARAGANKRRTVKAQDL